MREPRNSIDFAAINAAALRSATAVLPRIVPGGTLRAGEYIVRNPRRPDRRPGSFRCNLSTGRWSDFATGDKGGDLISYVAYVEQCSQVDAARLLARLVGIEIEGGRHHG